MPMPPYPVLCYGPGCTAPAAYKVAACWSDGSTQELKTYSLTCHYCLATMYAASRAKRAACRLAPGETLDEPGIYALARGGRDQSLARLEDVETDLSAGRN
jgi:hypothetical protein